MMKGEKEEEKRGGTTYWVSIIYVYLAQYTVYDGAKVNIYTNINIQLCSTHVVCIHTVHCMYVLVGHRFVFIDLSVSEFSQSV